MRGRQCATERWLQTASRQQRRICLERTGQSVASHLMCETLNVEYSRINLTLFAPVRVI